MISQDSVCWQGRRRVRDFLECKQYFSSTPFLSFHVFSSLPLTLQTPQRTRRRKLNALFQRDNLSTAEERVCKIPSHSAYPWGDTKSFSPLLLLLSPSGWIAMMAHTACTESFVWQIKKRMLTLDRLWHCVYQTRAVGEVDLNNTSQSCPQSICAHKQCPKEIVILVRTKMLEMIHFMRGRALLFKG